MPYITRLQKDRLNKDIISKSTTQSLGELNYVITKLCLDYLSRAGVNYTSINSVVGMLESAKLEFYHRIIADYKDDKIEENGDVYYDL
jgi:hypothetical protein